MIRKMGITWHLRLRMAEKGMFQTTALQPLLAERGIHLSREQVFRLVTGTPQRLSTDTLAALCDIPAGETGTSQPRPRRATVRRPIRRETADQDGRRPEPHPTAPPDSSPRTV
ncbi:helix-turn-helix domain-containing protein [Streptomyces collinus]|uniref:helix-turn-helix domain-containing protein n=1 Tax=Streptomyces collinus TaxID=42684 RepID=UPI003662C394